MSLPKVVLPDAASFKIVRRGGKSTSVYTERFNDRTIARRTYNLASRAMGHNKAHKVSISKDGRSLTVKSTAPFSDIADMIVTEFLAWSSISTLTVRDLMGVNAVMALQQAATRHGLSAQPPPHASDGNDSGARKKTWRLSAFDDPVAISDLKDHFIKRLKQRAKESS